MKCIEEPTHPFKRGKEEKPIMAEFVIRFYSFAHWARGGSIDTIHLFVWALIQLRSTLRIHVWIARWWLIIPPTPNISSFFNFFSRGGAGGLNSKEGGNYIIFFVCVWRKSLASSVGIVIFIIWKRNRHLSTLFFVRSRVACFRYVVIENKAQMRDRRLAIPHFYGKANKVANDFSIRPERNADVCPAWIWMRVAKTIRRRIPAPETEWIQN
jgi:signal transduction histidine kinase